MQIFTLVLNPASDGKMELSYAGTISATEILPYVQQLAINEGIAKAQAEAKPIKKSTPTK